MKPTPWKLVIVVGALCGAGAAAAGQDTSKASGATLLVNDSDALGQQGDDRLALAEAIRLANGGLALAQLSVSERRQVRGVPGVGRADRIRFAVKERVVRFPLQIAKKPEMDFAVLQTKSFMPVLAGNGGDEIDGKGVRFTNGPDDATDTVNAQTLTSGAPLGGAALVIESSDFTIRNAQFERFIDGLIFRPATGAASMTNVRVINNQFHKGGGIAFSGVSAGHERSALRNILIEGNTFLGPAHFGGSFPSKLHTAIAVTGATAAVAKGAATAKDVVVEDVQISRNTVRAFAGGVQVQPLQTLFAANRGAVLNRLHISGNDIALDPEAGDPAVYIWGAVSVNGQVSDVRVTGIRIENNKVLGNGHVLFIAGVEALMGGDVATRNIHMEDIRIAQNRIASLKSCSYGITTIAAFPEMGGPPATGLSLKNVRVVGNTIEGCAIGAFSAPVLNVGAPGASSGNEIAGLSYEGNSISGAETGIVVTGGALTAEKFKGSAAIHRNRLSEVIVRDNRIGASKRGILVAGAFASGEGAGTLSGNVVGLVDVAGNRMKAGQSAPLCHIRAEFSQRSSASMVGNRVKGGGPDCVEGPSS